MGYNYDAGHCDEICDNCTYTACIEHPQHNKHRDHELKLDVICKVCGKPFDQADRNIALIYDILEEFRKDEEIENSSKPQNVYTTPKIET